MYDEAIILEVKRNYAIAMKSGGEICRINLKDGIKIGDSVYILPEDIYKENKNAVLSPTALPIGEIKNKPLRKNIQRIAGLVAVFLICCTVFLFQQPFKVSACSVISFDSNGSIQLELDKDYNIIRATSVDGSVSQTVLDGLVGKNLKVIATELYNISGGEADVYKRQGFHKRMCLHYSQRC